MLWIHASIFHRNLPNAFNFQVCVIVYINSEMYPTIKVYESEKQYEDPGIGEKFDFPSIKDPPTRSLSVVVPAYNEEARCKYM